MAIQTKENWCHDFLNKLVTMVKQDCYIPWTTGSRLWKAKEALTIPAGHRSVFNVSLRYSAWGGMMQVYTQHNEIGGAYPFLYNNSWVALGVDSPHPGYPLEHRNRALPSSEDNSQDQSRSLQADANQVTISDIGVLDTQEMRRLSHQAKTMIREHMKRGSALGMFPGEYEWQVYRGPINFATIIFINYSSSWLNIVKRHDFDAKIDLKVVAIAPRTSIKLPPVFIDETLTLTRGQIEKASPDTTAA